MTTTTQSFIVGDTLFVVKGVPAHRREGKTYSWFADVERAGLQVAREIADRGIVTAESFHFVRRTLGFRAMDVAELLSRTPETISHWENGRTPIDRAAWATLASLVDERLGEVGDVFDRLVAAKHPKRLPKKVTLIAA